MAKKYELVLIIDPPVGDTQLEAVEKYKTQLEFAGAEVVNVDPWGLRKLAYTSVALRQRQQAFYVLYQFEGNSELLVPLEAALRLAGHSLPVAHPMDILDRSYRAAQPSASSPSAS